MTEAFKILRPNYEPTPVVLRSIDQVMMSSKTKCNVWWQNQQIKNQIFLN